MMKEKDNIEKLFERLHGDFDFEEPAIHHEQRFLEKLNDAKGTVSLQKKKKNWLKPIAIAASFVFLCVLGFQFFTSQATIKEQVVEIAPEVSNTEFYFAGLIEAQVQQLQDEKSPETAKLVEDTLLQLHRLEKDYEKIEEDLINGGNKKIILNAMIINFQTRIDLLQEVLENMEEIKNLKANNDANYTI